MPWLHLKLSFASKPLNSSDFTMKPKVYQFLVALFASFGSFLYGYDLGVIASVVSSDSFINEFLQEDASTKSGTVVALFTGGVFNFIFNTPSADAKNNRCFLWRFRCWILRPSRSPRNGSPGLFAVPSRGYIANSSGSHRNDVRWPAICWLWYRNLGGDRTSIPS